MTRISQRTIRSLAVKTREIPRLVLFLVALVSPGVVAQTTVETPRTIRVVVDNAYAPYSFQSDQGKLQGILIDQWQAWEKKTGIKVEFHAMDWGEALRRMRAGEFDVIESIVETPERRDYFDFTPAYTTIEASIFFRNEISGIKDLASLKGFPVGVKTGDQHIEQLKANGVTTVIPFQSNDAIIEAAKEHKISVFLVDDPSALYLLNKTGIEEDFRHSAPIFKDELRRAVRKGNAALLRTVSEGFAAIEPGELRQIDEKWFGRTINRYRRYLTYAGYAAAVAILLIAGLVGWTRALRRRILQRTAALGESEQRFRQIAENIREVFWLSTADLSNALYISPAYESVWGRSRESLYQDLRSSFDAIHHEDRSRVITTMERDRGQGFEVEYRVVRPDGSIRWIWDRGFPIRDESGRFYRVAGIAEDITERKQAEDAVRRSEDRIRLIIDTIPTMAWSIQPDGTVDFANQRWLDYAGVAGIEDPNRIVHPEDLPVVMKKWLADMAAGRPSEDEMRLRRADGEYRWFLVRTAPLRDEQGNLVKWYGVSTDIEDRKRAEEKLKQSESQLAEAQRLAHIGSWDWDIRSDAATWSDELYRIFGLEPGKIRVGDEAMVFVHPEDRDLVRSTVKGAVKNKESYSFYYRILRPDGDERIVHSRGQIVSDDGGNPIRVLGATQDVTERKRAEEALREAEQKYRDIFENAGEGIFQSTPEGRYLAANPALARIYGFASPAELIHSRQDISLQVYVDPTRREEFKRQLEEHGAVRAFEHEVFRKDGSRLWISVNAHAVRDDQGAIQYYEGTAQDITERKAAEEELKGISEQLRALSARLQSAREEEGTRIAREIHDELGSMLTGLKWDLEEISKMLSTQPGELQLAVMREKLSALTKLTDMSVSTLRRIASELRPNLLDDLGLGAAIEWQTQQFQARTGIICHCECSQENIGLSEEQSTAVFRIFQEALTNVLRHAQATSVEITIEKSAGYFVLVVGDNGKGITQKEKSEQQSLGILGMRERAHLIGAEIDIKGREGKGTVVTVRVPIPGEDRLLKMTR